MTRAITTHRYDPFASRYDDPSRGIIGGIFDSVVNVVTAPVKAVVKASTGDFKGAWHSAKGGLTTGAGIVTGSLGKSALAGAAIVFPPAAPALAGVYAGAKVLQQLDSKNPTKRAGAALSVASTRQLAQRGDPGASRGWAALQTAQGLMRQGATPLSIARSAGVDTSRAPTQYSTSYSGIAAQPVYRGTLVDERGVIHPPGTWRRMA